MTRLLLPLALALSLLPLAVEAQVVTYTYDDGSGGGTTAPNQVDPNATASNTTYGPGTGSNSFFGGNPGQAIAANGFNSAGFDADDYFGLEVSPNSGFELDLSSLTFDTRRSSTGPPSLELRSSLDNYASTVATGTASTSFPGTVSFDLSGAAFQDVTSAVTFRIYAFGASSGSGTLRLDNVTLNGDVVSTGGTVTQTVTVTLSTADGGSISEDGGTTQVTATITTSDGADVDADGAGTIDVALTSGTNNDDFTASVAGGPDQDLTAGNPITATVAQGTPSGTTFLIEGDALQDTEAEGDESFTVSLVNATGGVSAGSPGAFSFTIVDDEVAPVPAFTFNEVHADPADGGSGDANGDGTRDGSEDEFVEIVNTSGAEVDISGYTLSDAVTVRHTFDANTTVPAGGAVVVFGGGTLAGTFGGATVATASTGLLGLNNNGDTVTLADADGAAVAAVTYGGEGGNDQALARDPDLTGGFVLHSTIASNPVLFSPGVRNEDGQPFATVAPVTVTADNSEFFNADGVENNGADWRLLGMPVRGQEVDDIAAINLVQGVPASEGNPAQFPSGADNVLLSVNAAGDGYEPAAGTGDDLVPGRGFFWYWYDNDVDPDDGTFGGGTSRSFENASVDLSVTGPPVSTAAVYSQDFDIQAATQNSYMIANPFTEPLGVDGIGFTNASGTESQFLQIWQPSNAAGSHFQTVDRTSTTDFLDAFQGAFVEVTDVTDGADGDGEVTITFDPAQIDGSQDPDLPARAAPSRLTLALGGALESGVPVVDRSAEIYALDGATAGWDSGDASKLFGPFDRDLPVVALAPVSTRDGAPYYHAVYSLGTDLRGTAEVPVALFLGERASLTITPEGLGSLPGTWTATLYDAVTGQTVALEEGRPYAFDAEPGGWTERFTVSLTAAATASGPDAEAALTVGAVYPNPTAGAARITVEVDAAQPVRVSVYDALGREVAVAFDAPMTPGDERIVTLGADALAPGVYVVRVQGETFAESRQLVVAR